LATSSRPYKYGNLLKHFGLEEPFDVIVTGQDVERAKPDPAIFLLTAKKLDVEPKECVVFEDTTHGVIAAKEAGMKVIAVTTGPFTIDELEAAGADHIVGTLEDNSILTKIGKL
jgi:beta-phosphoglucomutase-like phosphatase (HAD superfamily)